MSKELKKDILKYQKELEPFLNALYNCSDEQTLGCVAKLKTPSPKIPSPKKPSPKIPSPKTRKRCPKGTRKNKKTGKCESIGLKSKTPPKPRTPSPKKPSPKKPSPKKPSPKTRKRCPKGTRKNKKTGKCDPIVDLEKTQSLPIVKTPSPPKPEVILQVRDLLYNTIGEAVREVNIKGASYLDSKDMDVFREKFKEGQLALKELAKLSKQEEEYKELTGHSLEYHIKKNLEVVKETPEMIYKRAEGMVEQAIKDPKKAHDTAFIKTFNELRKKLKSIPLKDTLPKYEEFARHTLKFFLKGRDKTTKSKTLKKKTLKKKTVSIPDTAAGDKFKKLNKMIDNHIKFTNYEKWYVYKPDKATIEKYDKTREELNSMYKDRKNPVFVKKYKPVSLFTLDDYLDKVKDSMYMFKRVNQIIKNSIEEYPRPFLIGPKKIYERYRKSINEIFTVEEPIFLKIFYPITQFTLEENVKKNLPPESSPECNMLTICQYGGSCWFVTVFMMLAKIKPLYNLLKSEHQTFVDGLLLCPRRDMGSYCKLPPPDIWKLYREKHRKHKSVHEFYDSKDSIKLDESFEKGGYSFILFKAIMQINKIYYLSNFNDLKFGDDIVKDINLILNTRKNACEWLLDNYKKGKGKTDYFDVLMKHGGSKYRYALQELTRKEEPWPTEESLKKGICYRTTITIEYNE